MEPRYIMLPTREQQALEKKSFPLYAAPTSIPDFLLQFYMT